MVRNSLVSYWKVGVEMEGSNQKNWTVVGGGSGGHAVAGHLALLGHDVRLYDISQSTVEIINREKGIILDGEINGKGKIEYATTDLAKALDGADIIMVVVPATAHGSIARKCAPFLKDGQIVLCIRVLFLVQLNLNRSSMRKIVKQK